MSITPQFLDELRNRLTVSEIVGRRVKLVKKGREFHGLCPFHSEKSPSFTVNDDKGFYHCFGCGKHGDVVRFSMEAEGLGFREAIEQLAGLAGLPMPVESSEDRQKAEQRQDIYEVLEAAAKFFEAQLAAPSAQKARDYLGKERGLRPEVITQFRLGFAPPNNDFLTRALRAKGAEINMLVEAGLSKVPEDGRDPYDYFRDRIMFPIRDRQGRVIAFGARAFGDIKPKYLNSPDSPVFHKGRGLYNIDLARETAYKSGEILVCEGYMDVIALAQAGLPQAVAPLGTAITEDQIQMLWRVAPEPLMCLDGDSAGQRAAFRAADRALPLLKPGHSLRFAWLPAGEDPDSLVKSQGVEAIRALIAAAQPLSEVLWRGVMEGRSLDTPERQAEARKLLFDQAGSIKDPTVKEFYFGHFRNRLDQLFGTGKRTQAKYSQKKPFQPQTGYVRKPLFDTRTTGPLGGLMSSANRVATATHPRERAMLAALINHPSLFEVLGEELSALRFQDTALDKLLRELISIHAQSVTLDEVILKNALAERGYGDVVEELTGVKSLANVGFARKVLMINQVEAAFRDEMRLHRIHNDLREESLTATADLVRNTSDAEWQRFGARKRQVEAEKGEKDSEG